MQQLSIEQNIYKDTTIPNILLGTVKHRKAQTINLKQFGVKQSQNQNGDKGFKESHTRQQKSV